MRDRIRLSDVSTTFMGITTPRANPSDAEGGTPIISIKDINEGQITPSTSLSRASVTPDGRQLLQLGDVLVSIRGTLLKTAVVTEGHIGALASSNFAIVRPDQKLILPHVVEALFLSEAVRTQLMRKATGTTILGLSISIIRGTPLKLPPMQQQACIADLTHLAREEHRVAVQLAARKLELAFATASSFLETPDV